MNILYNFLLIVFLDTFIYNESKNVFVKEYTLRRRSLRKNIKNIEKKVNPPKFI